MDPPCVFLGVKGIDTAGRRVVCSRCVSLRDDCKEDSMENLADCIRMWMIDYKKNSVKPSTYDRLIVSRKLLERYTLAWMPTDRITVDDIQRFVNELVRDGYAWTTIKKEYSLLTAFYKFAYSRGLSSTLPYVGVELPREANVKKLRKDIDIFAPWEQECLKRVLYTLEDVSYAAGILMLETGMRVGETLALEWDDILWNRRAIRVSKTLVRLGGVNGWMFVQRNPKSKSSIRTIPMSKNAEGLLRRLLSFRKTENPYLFPNENDPKLPISYDALRYRLQSAFSKANVEYRGFHTFRHTFASNCYAKGCDVKILSKLLGHRDASITYNIYMAL